MSSSAVSGRRPDHLCFKALTDSSKIVPFVYSYHNIGMDHQDYAPEFENGDHAPWARVRLWQGTRLAPYGGDIDDFLHVNTLDRTAMASPATYVDDELNGVVTGKMTPYEAADYLDKAAAVSEEEIEQAAKLNPDSDQEFRLPSHGYSCSRVAWEVLSRSDPVGDPPQILRAHF